ncbi:MAG TPA: metallopeptidase family protein [Paenirhodobacter sp.]
MAEATRAALPQAFRAPALHVLLRIADFAPDDVLDEMQIDDPFALTGLYEGVPLTQKSVMDPTGPDVIWLFRRAILDEWIGRGDVALDALVAHVFVHELAHHFGWSDADIAAIDRWWE